MKRKEESRRKRREEKALKEQGASEKSGSISPLKLDDKSASLANHVNTPGKMLDLSAARKSDVVARGDRTPQTSGLKLDTYRSNASSILSTTEIVRNDNLDNSLMQAEQLNNQDDL